MFIACSLENSLSGNNRVRYELYVLTQDSRHSLRYQRLHRMMIVFAKNGTGVHHLSVSLPKEETVSNTIVGISQTSLLE